MGCVLSQRRWNHQTLFYVMRGVADGISLSCGVLRMEEYNYWDPECVLIEAKASGMPLTQELRSMGIPVQNYSP